MAKQTTIFHRTNYSRVQLITGSTIFAGSTIWRRYWQRPQSVAARVPGIIEKLDNGLSPALRLLIEDARQDFARLDSRIDELTRQIERIGRDNEAARRLQTIPGIGPLTATAMVADPGDARQFRRGREVSAFLGIVPRQYSSGGKDRLLGISKQGDRYLRTLLIHGASAALRTAGNKGDPRSRWAVGVSGRRHKNIAAVALANKNTRIVWALLTRGGVYDSEHGYRVAATQAPEERIARVVSS